MANDFKIQLTDTTAFDTECVRCAGKIDPMEDPEYIICWPGGTQHNPWSLHLACFSDIVFGMLKFTEEFIIKDNKKRLVQ